MKLKSILKRVNKRIQKNKYLWHTTKLTDLTKEKCKQEHYLFTRNLSFLHEYSTTFKPVRYHSNLFDVEEGGEYSYLRIFFGKEWYHYVDIFNHRGFEDDDGERFSQSWGIVNMVTRDNAEFDTLEELRAYLERNYDKYYLLPNDMR